MEYEESKFSVGLKLLAFRQNLSVLEYRILVLKPLLSYTIVIKVNVLLEFELFPVEILLALHETLV